MSSLPEYVLDSGALIALERADPRMTDLLMQVRRGQARLVLPDAVLAQVWRGGRGRQARTAALLGLKPEQCVKVPLDTESAKRIGVRIGESGHADVVDVQVATLGEELRAAVITSDREDILRVSPELKERVIQI
ncbi:PIN domain-containing protein [Sphaerisporangium sp. NPDC051011]|uniref:PIN domain-containing protein n=1 Tax=Sphaerisporangium sp. NPDC051011 TaxID=3155792 RepID=UPI0033CB56D7